MRLKSGQKIIDKITRRNELKDIKNSVEKLQSDFAALQQAGGVCPPLPEFKHRTIKEYAQEYGCNILIETGTCLGDTSAACSDSFDEIHTIELSDTLYKKVSERFAGINKIHCYHGDSAKILPDILAKINKEENFLIFWLDAHYSRGITAKGDVETPIIE